MTRAGPRSWPSWSPWPGTATRRWRAPRSPPSARRSKSGPRVDRRSAAGDGPPSCDYNPPVFYAHVLADDEKRELLRIARATLREHAFSGRIPPGKPHRESLVTPAAVFVSLHRGKALRGCIGTVEPN